MKRGQTTTSAKTRDNPARNLDLELKDVKEKTEDKRAVQYIREKINQLLQVMGTLPLKPEELDDNTLLELDPIGIIAGAFEQILEYLKETNLELRLAKDELQAIFDATGVGLTLIDKDFRILRCNEKQREFLVDGNADDVIGKYCYDVYCNDPSHGNACPAVDTLGNGRGVTTIEAEMKGKYFHIITTALRGVDGEVAGFLKVFLDITERKIAEESEARQREFYTRTEKLVSLGQLSAGIAHELNTPLGTILGYSRLLVQAKDLSSLQQERLEIIAEQAKKASNIIKQLSSLARQSIPVAKESLRAQDVNAIIKGVLKIFRGEAENRHIVILDGLGDISPLRIDDRKLEQVIVNMILNSAQAVRENGWIRIRTFADGNFVKIEVEDNGPGIPDQIQARIFDPFFTTKPVGEGTGLGLSICSAIIREHGGSIDVKSTEGKGALFTITLPAI
ncbi:MAG: PAS domain-containing protein [Desulfobacteraceae bacterium]|nr:MAG: PAS domain-containing protein [Desulfobacteraceae bacterium]